MNSNRSSERSRSLALQLIALETGTMRFSDESDMQAAERVCEALRGPLCTLAGTAGFRALLTRSLALAREGIPGLPPVRIRPDGTLDGLRELVMYGDEEASIAVISHLIGLLSIFIGESLTLIIFIDIWPDLRDFDAGSTGVTQE